MKITSLLLLLGFAAPSAHASCGELMSNLLATHLATAPELSTLLLDYETRIDRILWNNKDAKKSFKQRGDEATAQINGIRDDLDAETFYTGSLIPAHYDCNVFAELDRAQNYSSHYSFRLLNAQLTKTKTALHRYRQSLNSRKAK